MKQLQDIDDLQQWENHRTDKAGMAAHYAVAIRTIENWLARGILSAQRKGRKLEFDVVDCDRRVSAHKP
jgi:hypothetical protein